ncbi:MAG: ABC transporter permease [Firmicutes bacterium]|nr:ABC transporter permease [Bacillota bacterium]
MKTASRIFLVLVFIFLYAPLAVMILISFNGGDSTTVMDGVSLHWYQEMLRDGATLQALKNTVLLSVSSAVVSTLLGTLAALGIHRMRAKHLRSAVMTVTNIPMMNPDIVTGISMMLLFVFTGTLLHLDTYLSFWTLLIAHITFCLPYVILSILPKLKQMDRNLPEAAMDLGCTPMQSFLKVELPFIMPGIVTGLIMAFTLSFDDFIISNFTSGSGFETLTIHIFAMTKKSVKPDIYALSTLIFFVVLVLLLVYNFASGSDERSKQREKAARKRFTLRLREERGEL